MLLLFGLFAAAEPTSNIVDITLSLPSSKQKSATAIELPLTFPGESTFLLNSQSCPWVDMSKLDLDLFWPTDAPTNAQVLLYMMDWDYFGYQNLLHACLQPGSTNHIEIAISPDATDWKPYGHHGVWHLRTLMEPKDFNVRVFCNGHYTGTCRVERVVGVLKNDTSPPFIRNVRANARKIPCFEKFELTFDIPDKYTDPFDTNEVIVTAEFQLPNGKLARVDGFYGLDYYCETNATGDHLFMQGPPLWRIRFAPLMEGKYKYTLKIRDRRGEAQWGPGEFTASKAISHGFIHVSKIDPRYFDYSDGSPYFPIGHNIRSPVDARMQETFPWKQRWPEGFTAYTRYFHDMGEAGENLAEVWMASWSLGLEWMPKWHGYHGIGQFNMINAWELDKVLEEAERDGINLNIVIHNHGTFSTTTDNEWQYNPFNVTNGGYLEIPEEFFTDPRAQNAYIKLMHYMTARWGYSAHIFSWELWSELNLTGSKKDDIDNYKRKEVVEWHKTMCAAIKEMDPNRHSISTHVSGDFGMENKEIVQLPELDFPACDAYHGSDDPVHIVDMLKDTAKFNNPFGKPVMATEFGGDSGGQRLKHLAETLHAGLWASTCTPIGGTPLFWWWQLIEEENLYPEFTAVSRFMKDEDLRDPSLAMAKPQLEHADKAAGLSVWSLKNMTRAQGWICRRTDFSAIDPTGDAITTNIVMKIRDMSNGTYKVEFWDTNAGNPMPAFDAQVTNESLRVAVPAFTRDIAFKIRRR